MKPIYETHIYNNGRYIKCTFTGRYTLPEVMNKETFPQDVFKVVHVSFLQRLIERFFK